MTDYVVVATIIIVAVAVRYFLTVTIEAEYERGYLVGKEHIRRSLQLKAMRQHMGLSIEQVSNDTGLDIKLLTCIEECDYKEVKNHNYQQITDTLFGYYGEDKDTASIYIRFADKVIHLKPCNGFQSLAKRCSHKGKCSIPSSALMAIEEPKA